VSIIGEGEPFEALGYVVWGMLHDGEWHFSRTDATTFGARSIDDARERYLEVLIRNGWFASGTAERNPDFWTSGPFETLVDPATLPDYDPESISDQIARRDMLGMFGLPRMVAERRAEREEARREAIRQEIERRWVGANYARLRSDGVAPYAGCDSAGWMRVLVDSAGTRAIVPMTVGCREEGSTLLYWVLLREDNGGWRAYEWTLPGRREVTTFAGPEVVDAISRYTEWNFSFPWLGNERFWREHVLARDGASFRYLRELTK
jgi:hypothetical protein